MPFIHASSALAWKAGAVLSQFLVLSLISFWTERLMEEGQAMTGASGIMSGAFGAHALKAKLGDQAATWVRSLIFSSTYSIF